MGNAVAGRIREIQRMMAVVVSEDLTQEDMGEMTGYRAVVWGHWRTGHRRPGRNTVAQIVERLKPYLPWLTEEWLDYGAGEGPPSLGVASPNEDLPARRALPPTSQRVPRSVKKSADAKKRGRG